MRHFNFCFQFYLSDFFGNGFSPIIVRSRSSLLFSQWILFELHARTCPATFSLYNSKNLTCIGALPFEICSKIFMVFEVKLA